MAWKPKTVFGKILKGAVKVAGTVAATAFPVAGSAVTKAAAAFKAGVQTDTKKLAQTKQGVENVMSGGAGNDFNKLVGFERVKLFIASNWMLLLLILSGGLLLFIFLPRLLNKEGVNERRSTRRRSLPRSVGMKKTTRKASGVSGSGGFSRKINGKIYRSSKAWAAEMQRLRKKKG